MIHSRSRTPRALLALAVALALSAPALADIYSWTDARGSLRFSDNLAGVPLGERARMLARGSRPETPAGSFQSYGRESTPARKAEGEGRETAVRFEREHNLMKVNVVLNGSIQVPFYVDTAASGVTIPLRTARALGWDQGQGGEKVAAETANGTTWLPVVNLDSVRLGGSEVKDIRGTVNPHLEVGLLGGAFLSHFNYSVDTGAGLIVLRAAN
ncbi:MAG: retropepsin-like aspartic protease family protein [Planctomycetota bacterium]|jgi:clan AA aspartic protease (TIGR02281 family)